MADSSSDKTTKTRKNGSKVTTTTNKRGQTVRKITRKDGSTARKVTGKDGKIVRKVSTDAEGKKSVKKRGSVAVKAANRNAGDKNKGTKMAELRAARAAARKSGDAGALAKAKKKIQNNKKKTVQNVRRRSKK